MAEVRGLAKGLALILDLDGVVIDSNPVHTEAWRLYLRRCGIEPDDRMPERMFGRRNDEIVRDFFGPHLNHDEMVGHGAAKEVVYRQIMKDQLTERLVPGVASFLKKHRTVPIGLATNAEPANAAFILKESGLRPYFQAVVNGYQVERPKPDPEIYLRVAELLRTPPRNCVVFEDSFTGVEAARAAGARVVVVRTTHRSVAGASLDIDNFLSPELEPWLWRQVPTD